MLRWLELQDLQRQLPDQPPKGLLSWTMAAGAGLELGTVAWGGEFWGFGVQGPRLPLLWQGLSEVELVAVVWPTWGSPSPQRVGFLGLINVLLIVMASYYH